MLIKIILTAILLIGVINPSLSIRLFEFWKLGRGEVTEKTLKATRIMSVLAIVIVWWML
ncbi:histidine kinase [Fusibacter tunisiensis]|jgi:hypothetical protein|uniref:DUF6199 domain-containing protein n=1 Tax=Fusibacter tunisiensis TaxID=1008308 RepID=A0ABS2MTU2_9FIRM|nr:histidine kinase [Fusibacter tunisiensis]MBM7562800.1 hypothetical protein [Fusibacter tunisiensis]